MTDARWNTRRLYKFESEFFRGHKLNKSLPMAVLRKLAEKVWLDHEAPTGGSHFFTSGGPNIRAGRGVMYNGYLYSYYQEDEGIVLARNQRTIPILLHELTHTILPDYVDFNDDHSQKFVDLYFDLLWQYAGLGRTELMRARIKYKI